MRRLALFLLLITAPLRAQSFVQAVDTFLSGGGANVKPHAVTYTTGHGLVVFVGYQGGLVNITMSDGASNSYTPVDSINYSGGSWSVESYYNCNITGGSLQPQAAFSASPANSWIAVQELSGQATSSCLDVHADSAGNPGVAPTLHALTTTAADYVAGFSLDESQQSGWTAGSGFTLQGNGGSNFAPEEEQVQGAAGSVTIAFGGWTTGGWAMVGLALKPSGGGGGGGTGCGLLPWMRQRCIP